jgi:hypothetical protein
MEALASGTSRCPMSCQPFITARTLRLKPGGRPPPEVAAAMSALSLPLRNCHFGTAAARVYEALSAPAKSEDSTRLTLCKVATCPAQVLHGGAAIRGGVPICYHTAMWCLEPAAVADTSDVCLQSAGVTHHQPSPPNSDDHGAVATEAGGLPRCPVAHGARSLHPRSAGRHDSLQWQWRRQSSSAGAAAVRAVRRGGRRLTAPFGRRFLCLLYRLLAEGRRRVRQRLTPGGGNARQLCRAAAPQPADGRHVPHVHHLPGQQGVFSLSHATPADLMDMHAMHSRCMGMRAQPLKRFSE